MGRRSEPRVAAIEKARNVTIDVLERDVDALGGKLQVTVIKGNRKIPLLGVPSATRRASAAEVDSATETKVSAARTSKSVRKKLA